MSVAQLEKCETHVRKSTRIKCDLTGMKRHTNFMTNRLPTLPTKKVEWNSTIAVYHKI